MRYFSLFLLLLLPTAIYSATVTIVVGKVRLEGSSGGLGYVTKSDGTNFAGCSQDSAIMYMPTTYTADQKKSFLAFFLTAKSTGASVLITYTGSDNYCRMTDAEIQ
jgi:hypothetical protein